MQAVKKYPAGTFSWIDLATTDQEAAKAFYSGLFGWEAEDTPIPDGGTYTMFRLHGKSVAGLSALPPQELASGHPPYWSSYITVYDLEKKVKQAEALGATIMAPPFPVLEEGRMAVIQDPTAAIFCLWEPINHIGASYVNMPNTLVWNELNTWDKEKAAEFYSALLGWRVEDTVTTGDMPYTMIYNGERGAAGIIQMTEEWEGMGSQWMVYFLVEDVAGTAATVEKLGGNVMVPPTSMGEMGTFAVVADPQGGVFTVMASSYVDPPPGVD